MPGSGSQKTEVGSQNEKLVLPLRQAQGQDDSVNNGAANGRAVGREKGGITKRTQEVVVAQQDKILGSDNEPNKATGLRWLEKRPPFPFAAGLKRRMRVMLIGSCLNGCWTAAKGSRSTGCGRSWNGADSSESFWSRIHVATPGT